MPLFDFSKDERASIHSIKKRTLKMILEASKSSYPEEFGAILRARKGVIHELILLPGTIAGERSALFRLHNLPIDFTVVGTVHSHPSGSCRPSGADLDLFRRFGWVHIIVCEPYDRSSWAAYDGRGARKELKLVD
ncbi:MAG: Mov34/MPN/PAD-1 family protein [Thermoplasmata archaeon]